jgi:hypothetical protein
MTTHDSNSRDGREQGGKQPEATHPYASASRRRVLETGAALGSLGLLPAAVDGTDAGRSRSESVPDGTEFDNLVGAYYYGWYVPERGRHWDADLDTADGRSHTPTLGEYSSHDQAVVDQHIEWALSHGINWFNCTWWGPDTNSEVTILDYLLESQHADKMHFSLLYEPLGRDLGGWADFGDPEIRQRLQDDLQYVEDTFFDDPNWLHVDGRPVLYFWINRMFTGDVTGAFEDAISTLDTEPYIVGDNLTHAEPFDAVANFATVHSDTSDWDTYVDTSRDRRVQRATAATYGTDQDYIPSVQPGASWPDPILDHDADRFRDACEVMAEAMDEDLQAAIVCSFNEWHEGSTLEPAEEYGTSALEVVDEELQGASPSGDFLDGEYARVRFAFSDTARPADNGDSGDVRPLAFWLDRVRLEANDGTELLSDTVESSNAAEYQVNPTVAGVSGKWFGTPLGVGSLVFERSALEDADTLVLTGHATDDLPDLTADVSVNGTSVGTVSLGTTNGDYSIPVPEEIPAHPAEPSEPDEPGDGPDDGTGLRTVDDSTVEAVWLPGFDVQWPDFVYLGYATDDEPRTWEQMTRTADRRFEATVGGLSPGTEIDYEFSYYDDGWQFTDGGTYTFQPDGGGASGPGTDRLTRDGDNRLDPGEHLESSDGAYRLYFQASDGNLVLRDASTGDAKWATMTNGDGATRLTLQGDGNLVMYTGSGDAVWASNTAGSAATELVLEDDGTLLLGNDETAVWTANE